MVVSVCLLLGCPALCLNANLGEPTGWWPPWWGHRRLVGIMPRFSWAFTPPSLHGHFLSLFTHICPLISTIWDTSSLAGVLGNSWEIPGNLKLSAPASPSPLTPSTQHPASLCISQRQHQASFQASGMRESCQWKSKIMQLNYKI